MSALLEIRGLCAFYGRTQVLFGLDLDVAEGGVTTLLGANGAGKTTTLRAVSGMLRTTGDIRFAGERIAGRAIEDIVRLGIAHAPEGRGTFVRQTVEENLQIGAMARNGRAAIAADMERVYGYFPRLKERRHQQAGTLSGGEQQMLLVEQNASLALDFADDVYLIETGRLVMTGPAHELRRDETIRRSYLGY